MMQIFVLNGCSCIAKAESGFISAMLSKHKTLHNDNLTFVLYVYSNVEQVASEIIWQYSQTTL